MSGRGLLVVFAGLPGTGKTTIAGALAARRRAVSLRIDVIEQAIRSASGSSGPIGPSGYAVAQALALSNLRTGLTVVADCVNPVEASRAGWRAVAAEAGCPILDVELICSDRAEHRRRVETRRSDIPGLVPPGWVDVVAHDYDPWRAPHLVIDTFSTSPDDAVTIVERHMDGAQP